MSLLNDLNWRYATKKMNGQEVPQEKLDYILEAARLAPSSSGLQPYKIFVIKDRELIKKIKPIAYQQAQFDDCSHVLVWAAWDNYTEERIGEVFNEMMDTRALPRDTMDNYKATIWAMYEPLGTQWQKNHTAKQSYISVGLAVAAAAEQKVDATPMEGFAVEKLDAFLKLNEPGYTSTVIMPLGYRDTQVDWLINMKKFRVPAERFVTEVKLEDAAEIGNDPPLNIEGIFKPKE